MNGLDFTEPTPFDFAAQTFAGTGGQDVTDDDIADAAVSAATAEADEITNPADVYGDAEWNDMSLNGDKDVLRNALGFEWGFSMTPAQRAKAAWSVGARRGFAQLYNTMNAQMLGDSRAFDIAHAERIRARRTGGGM